MKKQCEIIFSDSVPADSKKIIKLALETLDIEISTGVSIRNDIGNAFRAIKKPLINIDNYKILEGSKLFFHMTEQVRYNGIDFTIRVKYGDEPIQHISDVFTSSDFTEWEDNINENTHGRMASELPNSFIAHMLFGENPREEILEFFKQKKCILNFLPIQELVFNNYSYDHFDRLTPGFVFNIYEGTDS